MRREVGVVDGIYELDTADGLWVFASARVTDPPAWLKKGTPASYGFWPYHRSVGGWIHKSWLKEVSILSSAHEPKQPLARVTVLERVADSPAAERTTSRQAVGEVIHHKPGGERLIRPGIGQVLGVR
jgi:hypothetical protein